MFTSIFFSAIIFAHLIFTVQAATWPNVEYCGNRDPARRLRRELITNGEDATPYMFPWLVSLQKNGEHFCGGSILNEEWILTAAHCLVGKVATDLSIVAGDYNFNTEDTDSRAVHPVEAMYLHVGYDDDRLDNRDDIAVMKLVTPLTLSMQSPYKVTPICMPNPDEPLPVGEEIVIAGWGMIDDWNPDSPNLGIMGWTYATIRSLEYCRVLGGMTSSLEYFMDDKQMCFDRSYAPDHPSEELSDTKVGDCSGDSGSPSVHQQSDGKFYQEGLVSGGAKCGNILYVDRHTTVRDYIDWILQATSPDFVDPRPSDIPIPNYTCTWVQSNGDPNNEISVDADSEADCINSVMTDCPTATAVNIRIGGTSCYCQFGTTPLVEEPDSEYQTCLVSTITIDTSCDNDPESCAATCSEPNTCAELNAIREEGGCAETCCSEVLEPYESLCVIEPISWTVPFTGATCSVDQMTNDFTYTYCNMPNRGEMMPADIVERRECQGELTAEGCATGFSMCSMGTGDETGYLCYPTGNGNPTVCEQCIMDGDQFLFGECSSTGFKELLFAATTQYADTPAGCPAAREATRKQLDCINERTCGGCVADTNCNWSESAGLCSFEVFGPLPDNGRTCHTSEESSDSECSNDDTLAGALVAGASDMNINDCDSLKRWGELNFGEMFACDTFVTTITEFGMLNTEVEVAGTLTDICCEACTDTMACTLDVDSYQPESGECEEGEESFAFCEMTQCISNSDCTYDDFGLDNPDDEHICPTDLTEHEFLYQDDDGNEMVGYLIFPSDMDTSMLHPGVVVYGGFTGDGGQRMEREYAREYARKGMVAFLPDYFPGRHDQDDFDQVLDAAIQYSTLFQDGVRAQRLAMLAYEQLTSLPYVDSDRVGAFGFCFGGAMAMQAARAGANWKVAAGLHAEYPPMTEYIGDSWDMEYFAEFAGDSDPFIPPDHIEGWNEELSNSGSDYEVTMIENGLHGFAMKYSLASYQVLATFGGQSQDDIIYDEEGTAIGITGTFLYVEEQRDLAFNRIEELFEEYGLFTGGVAAEESTEGPSTCGCGEEIGTAFSNLESELQTQMAALMSETLPAQLDALLSVTLTEQIQLALAAALPERFVTAEDFAMLEDKVGDLEMDNNDVMNGMSDMATCMADIAGSMGGGGDDSYEMTDAPAETAAPTEYWQTIGRLLEGGNNKCSTSDNDRAFRLSFTSLENCLTRCRDDDRCQFASTNFMSESSTKYCIGCINLTQAADGWMAYEMLNDRRQLSNVKQLSEIERLRAENQRLRAELAEARRN